MGYVTSKQHQNVKCIRITHQCWHEFVTEMLENEFAIKVLSGHSEQLVGAFVCSAKVQQDCPQSIKGSPFIY